MPEVPSANAPQLWIEPPPLFYSGAIILNRDCLSTKYKLVMVLLGGRIAVGARRDDCHLQLSIRQYLSVGLQMQRVNALELYHLPPPNLPFPSQICLNHICKCIFKYQGN